ncbi:hypothetical protein BJI47_00440 [Rhodococcus sp. 1168]|nr:hypothetical protein BJI47_00440 [Rhodococcus sp. 1168]
MFDDDGNFVFYDQVLEQFNFLNLDTMQIVKVQTHYPDNPDEPIDPVPLSAIGPDGVVVPLTVGACGPYVAQASRLDLDPHAGLWWIDYGRFLKNGEDGRLVIATPKTAPACGIDEGEPISPRTAHSTRSAVSDPTGTEILFLANPDVVKIGDYLYRANLSDPEKPEKITTDPGQIIGEFKFIDWVTG